MKRKNSNFTKVVMVMLVLTMLALVALSGTYAKYVTSDTATGTAVIAKWDVAFSDGSDSTNTTLTIDLADTLTNGNDSDTFIQPGSKGTITVTVTNNSDVDATISAELTDSSSSTFTKSQFTVGSVTIGDGTDDTVAAGDTKDVTIEWEWTYDVSTDADTEDTSLGEDATGDTTTICTLKLTATQVDPNA